MFEFPTTTGLLPSEEAPAPPRTCSQHAHGTNLYQSILKYKRLLVDRARSLARSRLTTCMQAQQRLNGLDDRSSDDERG